MPLIVLTLGLMLFVINALMLLLTSWIAGQLDLGFHVDGFWTALWGSIVISLASAILEAILPGGRLTPATPGRAEEDRHDRAQQPAPLQPPAAAESALTLTAPAAPAPVATTAAPADGPGGRGRRAAGPGRQGRQLPRAR